uniref:Connector enhancer of kinase suppressor of ras 3 n=1 Tax=Cacopsylla melanoneura TaxID=428564 RepID=A0A8D9BJ07_9HEMI
MAYVNVADWKPDQVADWLKGLDVSIHRYVESFLNNHVNGQHLLNLQPDDLEHHGIYKVGHQEIILEAVDHLRNFHYELDHENLQLLALRVSCLAHSLYRELWNSSPVVSTQILSDVATIIKAVKPLVCWLDRPPFSGQLAFIDKKAELLRLSLEMATSGQRDKFADRPIEIFRNSAKRLSELADEMIREIHDPLLLQPSSLDLATLKKRPGDHLGFCIIPSFHGIHQIGDIKCNSTAYQSGKIECGDEIVQINYQTVVGWDVKQVMALFEESSSDIFLTLKKRPCHSKILGQIYMKPYRLPSKKQVSYGWFLGDTITPPRINLGGHIDIKPLGHKLVSSVTSFNKNRKPESFENIKEDDLDNNNQHKVTEKEEPADELGDVDDDNEHEDDEEEEEEEEEGREGFHWSPIAVNLLLNLRFQRNQAFSLPHSQIKKAELWNDISAEMRKNNFNVPGHVCDLKYRSLLRHYRQKKDKIDQGASTNSWIHFDLMDAYLGDKDSKTVNSQAIESKSSASSALYTLIHDTVEDESQGSSSALKEGKDGFQWTPDAIKLFLNLRFDRQRQFLDPMTKKFKLWEDIGKEMQKNGYNISGFGCDCKFRNLLTTYRTVKRKIGDGDQFVRWRYFEIFDVHYKNEPFPNKSNSVTPIKRVSVNHVGNTSDQQDDEEEEDEDEGQYQRKKPKMTINRYLQHKMKAEEKKRKDFLALEERKLKLEYKKLEIEQKKIEVFKSLVAALKQGKKTS